VNGKKAVKALAKCEDINPYWQLVTFAKRSNLWAALSLA